MPTYLRPATIKNPIYGYNKKTGAETYYLQPNSIVIMEVDNLPCELTKVSSTDFSSQFIDKLLPVIMSNLNTLLVQKACVLKNKEFTKNYDYLNSFLDKNSEEKAIIIFQSEHR